MDNSQEKLYSDTQREAICTRFLTNEVDDGLINPAKEVILVRESQQDEGDISLMDLIFVIKRNWKLIIIPSFVISLLIGLYSFTRPRLYSAQTTLVPPIELMKKTNELGSGLGLGGLQQSMLSSIMGESSISQMYVGILQSRTIAEKIIEHFNLKEVYAKDSMADVLSILENRTEFKVRDDGIINVQVKDTDPSRAADIANAFVEELDRQNQRLSEGSVSSKRKFLESRLTELRQELSSIDRIPTHEAKLKEMIFELLSEQYELARIEEAKSMPTIQILDVAVPPEKGVARGTFKKTIMAGIVVLILMVFIVFFQEYMRNIKTPVYAKEQDSDFSIQGISHGSSSCDSVKQKDVISSEKKIPTRRAKELLHQPNNF